MTVDRFIARQPIFDRKLRVVAYELLFRSGPENFFSGTDGDVASKRLIDDSLHVFGIDTLLGGSKAYVNATRHVIVEDLLSILPKERIVVEVLETVPADDEVVAALGNLKRAGYEIALDDFVLTPAGERLLEFADIVKVDFLATKGEERKKLITTLTKRGVQVLAEKVENSQEFRTAVTLGCAYFQGYFFCKPEMISRKDIPGFKLNYMRLLRELGQEQLDFASIERTIKADISLSGKLLRYLNSASFGWRQEIKSLQHALALLGERSFRKWASLVAVATMSEERPVELATTSLIRARFCELIALRARLNELDAFLIGMFSLVDAIVGRPLDELLKEIAVPPPVEEALIGRSSPLAKVFGIAIAMESASWDDVARLSRELEVDDQVLPDLYRESITWVSEILGAMT